MQDESGKQHTIASKVFGRQASTSAGRAERSETGTAGWRPFCSLRGEEPLLVWRWRAPYGNSRASSSLKRQTPNKSRICSTPSPSRSTPGIAGLVPIRALKVRHSPPTVAIPFETDPPTLISFFLGYTGHEDWKFDVDMETQMLGSVKPYTRQVKKCCSPQSYHLARLNPILILRNSVDRDIDREN